MPFPHRQPSRALTLPLDMATNLRLTVLVIAATVSHCGWVGGAATASALTTSSSSRVAGPCPDPQDIFPCVCSLDPEFYMDLDCSSVKSEEELAEVFTAEFPVTHFRSLNINGNRYLKVLRDGALGNTTYDHFNINNGVLETVEENSLSGSHPTATVLNFTGNQIKNFPFHVIQSFSNLFMLHLTSNQLQGFPELVSSTLEVVTLGFNPLGQLPATAFINTPSLLSINLPYTEIKELSSGTFSGLRRLTVVSLTGNHLTHLPEAALELGSSPGWLFLQRNNMSSVAVDAFQGLSAGHTIDIFRNDLTELEEQVWRPLLEKGVELKAWDNPLTCGCDIAWLVLNATLLSHLDSATTCSDGRIVMDLDPTIYQQCP